MTTKSRIKPQPHSPTAIRMAGYSLTLVLPQDLAEHYRERCDNEQRDDMMDMILRDLEAYHEHRRYLEREGSRLK